MLAIKNFGHYWARERIFWGRPNKTGHLLGYLVSEREKCVVDFREQIAIYILFDENREAVYLGQAGSGKDRLFVRLKAHTRDHLANRWVYFSWFGFRAVNRTAMLNDRFRLSDKHNPFSRAVGTNLDALNEIEAILLQVLEPRLNKQGPRWGERTWEFFQYIDDDETPNTSAELIQDIYDEVEGLNERLKKMEHGNG